MLRDDTLRIRVFHACERPHSWSSISVSRRSVIVERIVGPGESARPASPRTLESVANYVGILGEFSGTDRDGAWEGWLSHGVCPFSSPAEHCLQAHVTSEDLPAVLRALVDRLAGVIDLCAPTVVYLGVPEACQPRTGPVSGS